MTGHQVSNTVSSMVDLKVRELCTKDLSTGFFETLDALRPSSDIDPNKAQHILNQVDQDPNTVVAVAEQDGRIVGTGTLHILRKFLYGGSAIGLIEDVAIAKDRQRLGAGRAVIDYLLGRAKAVGCYKTVLYCDDEVLPFYRRLGFHHTTNGMRFDHASVPAQDIT